MPSQPVAEVMGGGETINMHGEGKMMADACGWEALALALVVWIAAAIAGRRRHG